MAGLVEGKTGTLPDGTRVVVRNGAIVPLNPTRDAGGLEVLGDGYKRNNIGQVYREGPKGGFQAVAGPTATMANDARTKAEGINQSLAGIDRVDRQLAATKDIGPLGWVTNPTSIAVLQQSVKDLQLKLKEQPYNLGVLNGPDLDLLEAIVANPGQLKSAAFRKTIAPRLANLSSILGNTYREQASGFEGMGGRSEAIPPLYRSPRSKYTADQWGRQGKVGQANAFSPPATTRPPPKAAQKGKTAPRKGDGWEVVD